MHRRISAAASSATLLGALLVATGQNPAAAATVTTLYASPTGSGTTCRMSAPCSLAGVQAKVRTLNSSMAADVDVDLLGGTYRATGPLQFGAQDSGQNGHQVVYQAAPGQTPIISGAKHITGFSLYNAASNIYRAAVPVGTQSRQLFVDGVRAQRARGPLNPSGFSVSGSSFVTADPSYASFTNQGQIEIVDNNDWKQLRCPLSNITTTSGGGSSLNVDPRCWANNNTNVPNPSFPFNGAGLPALTGVSWIENAYQLLTQPGQFYLDSGAGYLYYIPLPGQKIAAADVELPVAPELVDVSGTPGHLAPVDDTDPNAVYTGSSWGTNTGRAYGDLDNGVHYATTNGDSASYTFTGTGLQVLSELNSDEGSLDVYVDGVKTQSVSAATSGARVAQQPIATVSGLSQGTHTVKLVKTGGQYLLVDGFTVIPGPIAQVHDITFAGITFEDSTWTAPTVGGYVDNQAGVLWDPVTHAPTIIPAAVQVHRGKGITFTHDVVEHTGGSGIDLADQTQGSTVSASHVTDTSGIGVAVGEVDDYYQNQAALETSADTVTQNTIDHVGQDYSDAVGIFAGFTQTLTLSNNEIGYTPYSGISLGWGWGWQSDCTLQAKQGLANPCRHGTNYAGGNQITGNFVHDVMGVLFDGGPIYTNGGQGGGTGVASGPCQQTSVLSGNVVAEGNHTNNMLYHDEGSSCWNTFGNVVEFGGNDWLGMWTPTINSNHIHDNFSDNASYYDNGTGDTVTQATIVTGGAWPAAAQTVMAAAGPAAANRPSTGGKVDDDSLAIAYTGSWAASGVRGDGDYQDGVHYTTTNGDTASITFTGTGVQVVSETNSDEGDVGITLDGVSKGTVNANTASRAAQQAIYSVSGLAPGIHTIVITKQSGTYMLLDGFVITGGSGQCRRPAGK